MRPTTLILLLLVMCTACRKDKCEEPDYLRCVEHHPTIDPVDYYQQPVSITNPTLNPNNPDQIVFLRKFNHKEGEVTVYDRSTGESTVIFEMSSTFSAFSWSVQDWILMTSHKTGKVYKVRPDGTELTTLSAVECAISAMWNQTGDKFMVYKGCDNGHVMIYDSDGGFVEQLETSLAAPSNEGDWNHPLYYVGPLNDTTYVVDVLNQEVVFKKYISGNYASPDCVWISDTEYAYFLMSGIFISNIETGTTQQLEPICPRGTLSLRFPSYDAQSNTLVGRLGRLEDHFGEPTKKAYLFEYDLDTFELSIIE